MRSLVLILFLLFPTLSSLIFGPRFQSIFQSMGYNETLEGQFTEDAANIDLPAQEYVNGCEAILDEFWTEGEVIGNLYYFFNDAIRKRRVFNDSADVLDLMKEHVPRSYEYFVNSTTKLENIIFKFDHETQSFIHLVGGHVVSGFLALSKAFNHEIDLDEREEGLYIVGRSYNRIVFAHTWLSPDSSRELQRTFCISSFVRIFQEMGGPSDWIAHFLSLVEEAARFAVGVEQIQKAMSK